MDVIKNKTEPQKEIESKKSPEVKDKDNFKAEESKKENTEQIKESTCSIIVGDINYII